MKPLVSPFSKARLTSSIGMRGDQRRAAGLAHFGLGHAAAAERRIGVERIGRDAVADAALLAVEQVRRDDLEVVIGGMRERAASVAVAEREDARHIGAQLIVDRDVAARVGRNAGLVEAEIVGVRPPPDREQQMRADDLRRAFGAVDVRRDTV